MNRNTNFGRAVIDWPHIEGADAFLGEAWEKGYSASHIAKLVNEKFTLRATRNAVIGRLTRLGLTRSRTAGGGHSTANPKKPRTPAISTTVKRRAHTKAITKTEAVSKRHEQAIIEGPKTLRAILDAPQIAPDQQHQHVAYRDLAEGMCSWPVSGTGADMVCCGGKALPRKPYCAHHLRVGASR